MPPGHPLIARRFIVRGRVQGVGYRYFVCDHAEAIGVRGYTRNLADGSVEIYAVGTPAQVDTLAGYLHKGPCWSDVRAVEQEEAPLLQSDGFFIKH